MISKNFFESLESIAYERGLSIEDVLKKVEIAIAVAARDYQFTGDVKLEVDFDKKKLKAYEYKYVVEEVDPDGPKGQITIEDAQEMKAKVKVGYEFRTEVNFTEFGRKAASKFKQTLMSGLKELEREESFAFFNNRVGEIINAKVVGVSNGFISFAIGKDVEAHMPEKEALPGEEFLIGQDKKVYVTKVEKTTKGPKVYISRSNKEIVKRLFELMVPEIANGSIEIMGIARDPGSRTKIGVMSLDANVDPKGACVGTGGSRIRSINEVLNNEKIDIFTWKTNTIDLIAEALLPAQSIGVVADEKNRKAVVVVEDDQYSLAIGKSGQNARLAAYAINYRIDIKKRSDAEEEGFAFERNVSPR